MKKWFSFSIIGLTLITLFGCTIYIDSDNAEDTTKQSKNIIRKKYSKQPLTRKQLGRLIEMTVYTGPAEKYGDLILDQRAMQLNSKPVRFSHGKHRKRFTCGVCHTELEFSLELDGTEITRADYLDGRYCGACHNGKVAFSTEFACNACHITADRADGSNLPNPAAKLEPPLPKTKYGDQVDWVTALETDAIQPLNFIPGRVQMTSSMPLPQHLEKPLYWTTNAANVIVRFPHTSHTAWLDCSNCHPDLFTIKSTGTVEFDKESNLYGQFCGACHMNVAFPMNGCGRCHPGVKNYNRGKFQ